MKTLKSLVLLLFLTAAVSSRAQVTYTDTFSTAINYLTNGVAGTIWDGVYLGAGEIAGATGNGGTDGSVSAANAGITTSGVLTVASLETDWENAADDGVMFFKVITGDFDMHVQIVTPVDTNSFNFPGLMVRAFGAGGSPSPNGAENSLLWGRFGQSGIANMTKNNVNGVVTNTGLGAYPNSLYWLRITRSGNVFTLYQSGGQPGPWTMLGTVTRADLNGLPVEVGIEQSDYNGGATRIGQFANFSLTASSMGPFATTPTPPTSLVVTTNTNNSVSISWVPAPSSAGSLVVVSAGNGPVKEMPANGFTYIDNAAYGVGDTLPATNYYVVYNGAGSSVVVTNLTVSNYTVAVYSYAGSGATIAYTHAPAVASPWASSSSSGPANTNVVVDPVLNPSVANYVTLGDWNTNGNFEGWTTAQVSGATVASNLLSGTASGSDPQVSRLNIAGGPDLNLAYFDYIELRLRVPTNFAGSIPLYYGVTNTPGNPVGISTTSLRVFTIGNASIPKDGGFHVYRLFIGPQVFWRGNLSDIRIDPLGSAATVGQTFAIDYIRVGDLPGDVYVHRYSVNNPGPGTNDTANNEPVMDMESKHFRVIWDNWDVTNFPTFWKTNMPYLTLRNLEECWKTHIWYLGYTEPTQSWTPASRNGTKYKVNLTMFYGGYFSGGDAGNFGWVNITPDGLRTDPPTLVPPHEFTHVCQMHQYPNGAQNMDGQFWEHGANYARERWIYYYGPYLPGWTDAQSGLDPNYSYLSHLWIGHGRDYYLCWPWMLYLDENPDGLPDLGDGFVPKIWKTEPPGEYCWTTVQNLMPHNSLQDVIGYIARRDVMWDYSHKTALQAAENTGSAELIQRWVYDELHQRPDDPSWWQVSMEMAPQQTGYKIHQLIPQGTGAGRVVTVNFHGLPYTNGTRHADWRASFVVVSDSGAIRYSSLWNAGTNSVTLAANENTLYLSVAGTPNQFLLEAIDDTVQPYQSAPSKVRFPYEMQVTGATPKESTNSTAGLIQLPLAQGGGWRASGATVDSTAYVGPNARVLGSAQVRNNARILDYAIVEGNAQVLNNAVVSGHALVRDTSIVRDFAKVRDSATLLNNSTAAGHARILQRGQLTAGSLVQDWAVVKGSCSTWHDNTVATGPQAWNDAVLDGDFSTAQSVSNGFQFGFEEYNPGPLAWINARTAPRRLYAEYEFDTAHNSLAKDYLGVTDGYLQGNPAWISLDGKRSGFLTFDGSSQCVILDRSLSDLPEITVATWVKWSGGAANQPVWYFGSATNACMYFTPDDGTSHAKFVIRNGGADQTLTAQAAIPTGVWTHVILTLSNTVPTIPTNLMGRLYMNGNLQQQAPITITPDQLNAPNTAAGLQHNYLARGAGNSLPFFNGSVDSFRIYTGPLTNSEITALVGVANSSPTLAAVSNRTTGVGVPVTFTNAAGDPDLPWQTLTYTLPTAPAGATLDTNGVFTWRPSVARANTVNPVTMMVTDNGSPVLNTSRSFSITVNPLNAPSVGSAHLTNGQLALQINGDFGPDYYIQTSTNLTNWTTIYTNLAPVPPFNWIDTNVMALPQLYYRVLLGP